MIYALRRVAYLQIADGVKRIILRKSNEIINEQRINNNKALSFLPKGHCIDKEINL